MKNILKITLSLIVAIALMIVPMTVMAEDEVNYAMSDTYLTVGTNAYTVDGDYPYTVYILYPEATGDYTITTESGLIGIVSYLDMWVQNTPTEENVNQTTLTWSCNDVNQAIMVAVAADISEVNITVTRTDLDTSGEIPWIVYENKHTPQKFEMPESIVIADLDYVDTFEDDKADAAVLGDDGYYHLNDKNGPVLFANLNDGLMSLLNIILRGKLTAIYYDDNDVILEKNDFTDALLDYLGNDNLDELSLIGDDEVFYPLTDDIINFFKMVGETNNWYGETGFVGGTYEDAWMFACYYDADVTSLGNAGNSGNNNETNNNDGSANGADNADNGANNTTQNGSNSNNTNDTPKSPDTSDSTVSLVMALVSATALVIATKKVRE